MISGEQIAPFKCKKGILEQNRLPVLTIHSINIWSQAVLPPPTTAHRPPLTEFIANAMLKHYWITALRNLIRNKLFTSINAIGLSISIAVFLALAQYVNYQF